MKQTRPIAIRLLSAVPFLAGTAAFAWGIFCFLGGPDGQPWQTTALIAWAASWLLAALCAGACLLLNRGSVRARFVLLILWAVLLGTICFPVLIGAVFQGMREAASAPAVLLISGGIAFAVLFRRKRQ